MSDKASAHIKPCNTRQSEAHNWRTKEYLQRIKKEDLYIRTDLSRSNESWVAQEAHGMSLDDYHNMLARLVKEKTGRAMQMKVRERVNKKTGKVIKVNGSSALREDVVLCKKGTTIEDLQRYCSMCQERWGIRAIQIHIHRDEGHWADPERKEEWVPNLHAHIIWDWIDHSTGKSFKLDRKDMSALQDMVAEALDMERGVRKEETGQKHLERTDYIIAKQKREVEELDKEIADKRERAGKDALTAIGNTVADLFNRGDYAEMKKKNAQLEKDITALKEEIPKRKKELEKEAKRNAAKEVADLRTKLDITLRSAREQIAARDKRIAEIEQDKKRYRSLIRWILYKVDTLLRDAIRAIIDFARSARDHFRAEEARAIKGAIDKYSQKGESRSDVAVVLVKMADSQEELDQEEWIKAKNEVVEIAEGRYNRLTAHSGYGMGR